MIIFLVFLIAIFIIYIFAKKHKKHDDLLELPMDIWTDIYFENQKKSYSNQNMLISFIAQGVARAEHLGLINNTQYSNIRREIQRVGTIRIALMLLTDFTPNLYQLSVRAGYSNNIGKISAVDTSAMLILLLFFKDSDATIINLLSTFSEYENRKTEEKYYISETENKIIQEARLIISANFPNIATYTKGNLFIESTIMRGYLWGFLDSISQINNYGDIPEQWGSISINFYASIFDISPQEASTYMLKSLELFTNNDPDFEASCVIGGSEFHLFHNNKITELHSLKNIITMHSKDS